MYSTTLGIVNLKVETQKPFDIPAILRSFDYDIEILHNRKRGLLSYIRDYFVLRVGG